MTHLVVALKTNKGGKVAIAYIAAAERHEPVENAESLATIVASIVDRKMHMINGRNGIVAFGLHSVRARVHMCMLACVRACVRAYVCAFVRACVRGFSVFRFRFPFPLPSPSPSPLPAVMIIRHLW